MDQGTVMWGNGLPREGQFRDLLYNEPAGCLIAAMSRNVAGSGQIEELYYRHKSSSQYIKLAGFDDTKSLRDPVVCLSVPILFFNVWSPVTFNGEARGYDWEAIGSFNLTTGACIKALITPPELRSTFDGTVYKDVWVSSLVSADAVGEMAIVTVGAQKFITETKSLVEYWLCQLIFAERKLTKIAELPNVFA